MTKTRRHTRTPLSPEQERARNRRAKAQRRSRRQAQALIHSLTGQSVAIALSTLS